jgi:hypothetical protein
MRLTGGTSGLGQGCDESATIEFAGDLPSLIQPCHIAQEVPVAAQNATRVVGDEADPSRQARARTETVFHSDDIVVTIHDRWIGLKREWEGHLHKVATADEACVRAVRSVITGARDEAAVAEPCLSRSGRWSEAARLPEAQPSATGAPGQPDYGGQISTRDIHAALLLSIMITTRHRPVSSSDNIDPSAPRD